jgi:type I restriction enzyme M protein
MTDMPSTAGKTSALLRFLSETATLRRKRIPAYGASEKLLWFADLPRDLPEAWKDACRSAFVADNPALKGVLPKDYARPALDKQRLGQLIDLISNIKVGDEASRAKDVLGRVYEYFLSQFASAEGKKGGEFYTPRCVVKLLVEMLEPYRGRVYDPCCGSSGMFVQSVEFIWAHATDNGNGSKAKADISIYGQESNYTT